MRVLVAEDDPDIQVILRMVLTRMGQCEVNVIDQGDQVVGLVKSWNPGLVLLDIYQEVSQVAPPSTSTVDSGRGS